MPESALGLGFALPTRDRLLGGPGSFGTAGLGGCRAWALPEAALAYAYLPTQLLDASPDPRVEPLTAAVLAAARQAGTESPYMAGLREDGDKARTGGILRIVPSRFRPSG